MVSDEVETFTNVIQDHIDNHNATSFHTPILAGGLIHDETFTNLEGVYQVCIFLECEFSCVIILLVFMGVHETETSYVIFNIFKIICIQTLFSSY